MRPILLVAFALCVTAVEKNKLLRVHLDPESDTSLKSEPGKGAVTHERALIFVSRTSGAKLGEKLMMEYSATPDAFTEVNLHLYDIQNPVSQKKGLKSACDFLKNDKVSNLIVAAAGGDGTVSWAVSLLGNYKNQDGEDCETEFFRQGAQGEPKELNERIFIRHIGFGTGNDFAKSSGYTNEFDLVGGYKKKKSTWLDTLKNMNVRRTDDFVKHTMWETTIIAGDISSVSTDGRKMVRGVEKVEDGKKTVTEYTLLYLSGPYSGLLPCKVEQHRAQGGGLVSAANKNRLSFVEYGIKALRKTTPPLETYIQARASGDKSDLVLPPGSREFLLLVGKTFGGGKTPSATKTFGDSEVEMLTATGLVGLSQMKFSLVSKTEKGFDMEFNPIWEEHATGFASKLENNGKQVYTIQTDGECRRLEALTSIFIKPYIRFNVLIYVKK